MQFIFIYSKVQNNAPTFIYDKQCAFRNFIKYYNNYLQITGKNKFSKQRQNIITSGYIPILIYIMVHLCPDLRVKLSLTFCAGKSLVKTKQN